MALRKSLSSRWLAAVMCMNIWGIAAFYKNPVLPFDFPDPTVILASDGYYYAYGTGSGDGGVRNFSVSRSKDLVNWEKPWDAMPTKPTWAEKSFWAPHVIERNGEFFFFYAAEVKGEKTSTGEPVFKLGVAKSKSPGGPFVDIGAPLDTGDVEVNIDPMVFEDKASNKTYLYWGRNGQVSAQELGPDLTSFAKASKPIALMGESGKKKYEGIREGPFVIHEGDYYYMFYSGDDCCEAYSYAVLVARSKSPTGPFELLSDQKNRKDGSILHGNSTWRAPGHNSIVRDRAGQLWIAYHAIPQGELDPAKPGFRRLMNIDRLTIGRDHWPRVQNSTASTKPRPAPL